MAPVKWSCPKCGGVEGWGRSDCTLVQCQEERKKRHRLAEAAPDLLAACKAAEAIMRAYISTEYFDGHASSALAEVRAAIRKAEGGG